jgi:hypothetical protein
VITSEWAINPITNPNPVIVSHPYKWQYVSVNKICILFDLFYLIHITKIDYLNVHFNIIPPSLLPYPKRLRAKVTCVLPSVYAKYFVTFLIWKRSKNIYDLQPTQRLCPVKSSLSMSRVKMELVSNVSDTVPACIIRGWCDYIIYQLLMMERRTVYETWSCESLMMARHCSKRWILSPPSHGWFTD